MIETLIHTGNIEVVQLLIKSGADIEAKNRNGNSALKYAKIHGNLIRSHQLIAISITYKSLQATLK